MSVKVLVLSVLSCVRNVTFPVAETDLFLQNSIKSIDPGSSSTMNIFGEKLKASYTSCIMTDALWIMSVLFSHICAREGEKSLETKEIRLKKKKHFRSQLKGQEVICDLYWLPLVTSTNCRPLLVPSCLLKVQPVFDTQP